MIEAKIRLPAPIASPRWLLLLPRVAFIAFICAVATLLWLSEKQDDEEHRASLISDMLWLEQNLRFQMARNEELLGQLDRPSRSSDHDFESDARALIGNNTGLVRILLNDSNNRRQLAYPARSETEPVGETLESIPSSSTQRMARSLGRPVYTAAYPVVGNDWHVEVHVPVGNEQRVSGVAIGIYSLREILDESVPWWLLERYRIAIIEGSGKEIASRSKVLTISETHRYQLAFDPPGYDLALVATAYQTPSRLVDRLLMVSIVGLAIATLVSLWLVRKHVQQRIRAESALRKEYLFRQAMERSVQTGLRARDLSGNVLYVNEAFCRMVGWPEAELVGHRPPMPYWPKDQIAEIQVMHDRILAGEGPTEAFELEFRRRSGEPFTALLHEAPLIDENGQQTGWMASIVDISERKAAEAEVIRQQERIQATARLVAMGEVASGLAHELNQPLAAISSYCAGAQRMLEMQNPESEVIPALGKAVEQTQRAGQIIRRMYALARREGGTTEPINLAESLQSAILLVESAFKRQGIRVADYFSRTRAVIAGDAVMLEQTLFNLLRNAADSMTSIDSASRIVTIELATDQGYALLSISDRGQGIPATIGMRIFDPLFTTKQEGMGMGLSVCRSVVESHKGRIWFDPNPGGGTIFHIRLPLLQE